MSQDVGVEGCALIFSARELKWQHSKTVGGVQLYYLMIKGSIQEENIAIKNIYAPKIGTPQ